MLILTRRPGEAVCIGHNITIRLLGIKGNQVRLGIDAPRKVVVDREEIAERKAAQQTWSGEAPPPPNTPLGPSAL